MSINGTDGACPWGYSPKELDHLPNCVWNGGLADAPDEVPIDIGGQLFWPSHPELNPPPVPVRAPRSMGQMTVQAGPSDNSWMIYAGIGLVLLLVLGKGRR